MSVEMLTDVWVTQQIILVSLRSTFCLSPFSRYLIHVRPIHIADTKLKRTELLEKYELPVQFSSVPAIRAGLQVSRQCYKQNLYRRPAMLMTLRIAPPAPQVDAELRGG